MERVPMKRYTSMKVGGSARYMIYPSDADDLRNVTERLGDKGIPYRFFGNGTNVIVSDDGLDEALVRVTRMRCSRYRKTGDGTVAEISGGASLRGFIRENAERGLAGLERLYWIPGTVGGAVKMNAGSFGASVADTLAGVDILSGGGELRRLDRREMDLGYRESFVTPADCVVRARFHLKNGDRREILREMEYVYAERRKRHPMEFPSAGSVFKAVDGQPAWQFVEKAGLRGLRVGDACVSEKHTNFIVNLGSATARDIKMLIEKVKKEVYEQMGVRLREEVELWGRHE